MVVKTDGSDNAFGTSSAYFKAAPGVCIGIESRWETKFGTGY